MTPAPDYYEQYLLGRAVEVSGYRGLTVGPTSGADGRPPNWRADVWEEPGRVYHACGFGSTLADALYALLVDLGVTPPERPSAEQVDAAWQDLMEAEDFDEFLDGMRDYPDRLALLALLERGRPNTATFDGESGRWSPAERLGPDGVD